MTKSEENNKNTPDKIVMTFGTFDLFHPGHEYYLSEAKKKGDSLLVVIARDSTVASIKNKSSQENEDTRLQSVQAFTSVDRAILGSISNPYAVLSEYRPNILCFGYDQRSFNNESLETYLQSIHLTPEIHIIPPYHPEKYKSSKIQPRN